MIRIALTKGRIEEKAVKLLNNAGYDVRELLDKGRRLLFNIPVQKSVGADLVSAQHEGSVSEEGKHKVCPYENNNLEIVLAKSADVITYIEHGVCDIGIVGKDTIMEQGRSFYEVLDLNFGECKFALAGLAGQDFYAGYKQKVIATKYPNVAKNYFNNKGLDVEIVKIEGSVELAPILGLADGIVDIVESGATLRENGLAVYEDIARISARVIVNRASIKLKKREIDEFINRIAEEI